jgi:hypothetical protein
MPTELKDQEKINQMGLYLQHLLQYTNDGEDMLNMTVTGDKSWVNHIQPESKRVSMQRNDPSSPCNKKV